MSQHDPRGRAVKEGDRVCPFTGMRCGAPELCAGSIRGMAGRAGAIALWGLLICGAESPRQTAITLAVSPDGGAA